MGWDIYCHYEKVFTSYGVEEKGLFIDLNDCTACIIPHDTKPNYVRFATIPNPWKVGQPMNFKWVVDIKYSEDIPSDDMLKYDIADKIHNLVRIFRKNSDGFVMKMQRITRTQKKPFEPPFPEIEYSEILYNWDK